MSTKICKNCNEAFEVTQEDLNFYETMHVPEPTHCYLCRMQRRLSYRNERFLYHRKCSLTGKQIISSFSIDKPFPVYDIDEWWSDKWDPEQYGKNFDFSRPFFEQFFELRNQVPRLNLQQQRPMTNSTYCNCASRNKNCYLVFSTNNCEDCYYGSWVNYSRDCIDNTNIDHCELCYECVGCRDCYNLRFSRDCVNCSDSWFLRNCQGCKHCFGCTNQIEQSYMLFNKKVSKEEYERCMREAKLYSYMNLEKFKSELKESLNKIIVKSFQGTRVENCLGNYFRNCKNAYKCFECDNCEDIRYCMCLNKGVKNCFDYSYWGENAERIYECQACGYDVFQLRFCNLCWSGCSDLTYCDHSFAAKNCFGCVGLKKGEYYILNKKYSKEEYEDLVPRIIEYMKRTREWGEFFPVNQSIYAYNESLAHEQISLTKEEVGRKGWQWHDEEENENRYFGPKTVIPDSIAEVNETICQKILICQATQKAYKIIPQELKFYKRMGLPLPRKSPIQRHLERMEMRNKRKFYDRACSKCGTFIQTTYAANRPEIIYCEECYLKEVY